VEEEKEDNAPKGRKKGAQEHVDVKQRKKWWRKKTKKVPWESVGGERIDRPGGLGLE